MYAVSHTAPPNVVEDVGRYRGTIRERIPNAEIVFHVLVIDAHGRCGVVQVHVDATLGKANRPEEAAWERIDARVEVVDLRQRGTLPLKEIQSDEAERPHVRPAIHTPVRALQEAIVHVEGQALLLTSRRVDPRS